MSARIRATYAIAMAAARDAGNRAARAAGRTAWSHEDYDEAVRTFDRILPPEAWEREDTDAIAADLQGES